MSSRSTRSPRWKNCKIDMKHQLRITFHETFPSQEVVFFQFFPFTLRVTYGSWFSTAHRSAVLSNTLWRLLLSDRPSNGVDDPLSELLFSDVLRFSFQQIQHLKNLFQTSNQGILSGRKKTAAALFTYGLRRQQLTHSLLIYSLVFIVRELV